MVGGFEALQPCPSGFFFLSGDGSGGFGGETYHPSIDTDWPVKLVTQDRDGDGDLDAMLTTLGGVLFLETLGDGSFQSSSPLDPFVDHNITAAVSADIDGDSDLDLVTVTQDDTQRVYPATGSQLVPFELGAFPVGPAPGTLELFDIDLDGDLDSLVASEQDSSLRILRNNGSGYFSPAQVLTTPSPVLAMALGDVDGDGRADVVTAGLSQSTLFRNITPLTSPWHDVGMPLPGLLAEYVAGPSLEITGSLQPGSALSLSFGYVSGKLTPVTLVAGLSQLALPFKDGLLVPSPDVLVPLVTDDSPTLADVSGLNLLTTWPSGVPSGASLAIQLWAVDAAAPQGFVSSQGVVGVTP